MNRRALLKVLPAFVGLGFVLGWLTPKPARWMRYLEIFAMNLSWSLHHLSEKNSQVWLIVVLLVPIVLLVVLIVSVIGFVRIVQLGVRVVRHLRRPSDSRLKVSHFPSMITFVLALTVSVWMYGHHYRTMAPYWNIDAGEIIRESDLQYAHTISAEKLDVATDTRLVVGHKALKQLPAGRPIHKADISQ